jgi:hypothetical protein
LRLNSELKHLEVFLDLGDGWIEDELWGEGTCKAGGLQVLYSRRETCSEKNGAYVGEA